MRPVLRSAAPASEAVAPAPAPATADPLSRSSRTVVERIACWSVRHRKTAVVGWLAFVAVAYIIGQSFSGSSVQQYDPGQAGQAERMMNQLKVVTAPAESVLIAARGHTAAFRARAEAEVRQVAGEVERTLAALPHDAAADIHGPSSRGGGGLFSASHLAAMVTFNVGGPNAAADSTVMSDVAAVARIQAEHPGLTVREAGQASADQVAGKMLDHDFRQAGDTSVPLTLILLIFVFGALVAAGIPVLLAGTAVSAAVSLLAIPAHFFPVNSGTSEIVLVIGMAVGVDYTLFYLRREREERNAGHSLRAALRIAASTSGRSIVISGVTVMISLAGLFLSGVDIFTGISAGTIVVVGVTVLGSLTFLPALLSWLGPWADRGRLRWLGRGHKDGSSSRAWTGLAKRVVAKPLLWGGAGVLALLVIGGPALGMRFGAPSVDLPTNLPIVQTFDQIAHDFPGTSAPAQVVLTGSDLASPALQHEVTALEAKATASGPIRGPITAQAADGGRGMVINVPMAGNSTNKASVDALQQLENQVLPATIGKVPGVSYAVTGDTAASVDMNSALHARTPLVFIAVASLAFILLMCAFRSVTIPVMSIGLNLLSVGAAYGIVTFIFQDGHLQGPIGFTSFGGIIPWVPLFSFVLLFGLSMDYHVFILSRIRELWAGGASSSEAVVRGIGRSAGVVTSAAVIMVAVFSIFATLSGIDVKMLGVGLAAAVLIDATVVRGVILPAALAVLGERAWYLPPWLDWLPGKHLVDESAAENEPAHRGLVRPAPALPVADTAGG
jgi:putative drug exporter of the RND superfamily